MKEVLRMECLGGRYKLIETKYNVVNSGVEVSRCITRRVKSGVSPRSHVTLVACTTANCGLTQRLGFVSGTCSPTRLLKLPDNLLHSKLHFPNQV
jgi:hypothetical protein